jgi:hypothetical protein
MSLPVSTLTSYRILDDNELEKLQWRKDAKDLKLNTIFGNARQKFPTVFLKEKSVNKDRTKN